MKALVTGGGGFLGSAIVKRLLDRDIQVRTLQRGQYPHLEELGVECIRGSLADAAIVQEAVSGCDVVFHAAAKAGVWGSYDSYHEANVTGTEHILAACRLSGVPKLIYTSSPSVVFSGQDEDGINESAPYPETYLTFYPQTKALAEQQVLVANDETLSTVALRPHLIWGPGDPHLVPRVLDRAKSGRLRLVGRRKNLVDSTYVDNAALAHLCALDRLRPDALCAGRAFFISNGEPVPMAELINRILAAGGMAPIEKHVSPRVAYAAGAVLETVYKTLGKQNEPPMTRFVARQLSTAHWYDLTAARELLGYQPEVDLNEGFRRLAESLGAAGN